MTIKDICIISIPLVIIFIVFFGPILSLMWDDRKKKMKKKPQNYIKLLDKLENDYEMCVFQDCYYKIKDALPSDIMRIYYHNSDTEVSIYKIKNIEISNSKISPWIQELKIYNKKGDDVSIYPDSELSSELYDILLDIIIDKITKQEKEDDELREKLQKRDYNSKCRKAYLYLHNLED